MRGTTLRAARRGTAAGWIAAAAALGALLLAGCGGGGGSDDRRPTQELLVGTWRVARVQTAGQNMTCPGEIVYTEDGDEVSVACGANDTVTFFANGTFTGSSADPGAYSGTWQLNGNTLTFSVTTPSELAGTSVEQLSFSGDDTLISHLADGTRTTFERQ